MELKGYQASALDAFVWWRDALAEAQAQADTAIAALQNIPGAAIPDDLRNYPKTAWQQLSQSGSVAENAGAYVDRTDDANRPIPHVCFSATLHLRPSRMRGPGAFRGGFFSLHV